MTGKIILVRHGETDWNRVERFRGQVDVPLNTTGLVQAELTASQIVKRFTPSAIYSSPLSRALQTADCIARACSLPVEAVQGLNDIDYGEWQGLTPKGVHKMWPELADEWFRKPGTVQIPGGDSLASVQTRALATLDALAERHQHQEIVLVSHTVVIRTILLGILKADLDCLWQIGQQPCALNLIELNPYHYIIQAINCVDHLED